MTTHANSVDCQTFKPRTRHRSYWLGLMMAGLCTLPLVAEAKSKPAKAMPIAHEMMVVAAEPDAARAGLKILQRGGTAIDAAIAIQATLSLVEPQSSGIGGGSFMLYYDHKTKQVTAFNGRETAPKAANGRRFMGEDGKTLSYPIAVTSGRATGVPGAMFMLEDAHKRFGKLPWHTLFDEAISLSDNGFVIPDRLGYNLQSRNFPQKQTADFQSYFSNGKGGLLKAGDQLKNPAYGQTLRTIAHQGMNAFRQGPLAESIVTQLSQGPLPSDMTLDDLKAYRAKSGAPHCIQYRAYRVCEPDAPSGGVTVLQGLKLLEKFPINRWGKDDPRAWGVFIEAQRLIYADRDQYMADPDFVPVPIMGLLEDAYAKERARLITVGKPSPKPTYGQPNGAPKFIDDKTIEPGGTTHFVVIDGHGNAVSMTTTVESLFGSGRMAGGFFLNNQLTDFSYSPVSADGKKAANAVEGGKRPRSAMSPAMVFDAKGKLVAMIGSPGGPSIIAYNLKALIGMLDWGLSPQDAVALPNVIARGDTIRIEESRMKPEVFAGLKAMGYGLTSVAGEESGINGVMLDKNGVFQGGADPRRNGAIMRGSLHKSVILKTKAAKIRAKRAA